MSTWGRWTFPPQRTHHNTELNVSPKSKISGCCMQGSLSKEINVDSDCLQPFPFHAVTDDFFVCTEPACNGYSKN